MGNLAHKDQGHDENYEDKVIIAKATGVDSTNEDLLRGIDIEDYLVYDNQQAYEAAKEHILNSLWAFVPGFLAGFLGCPEEAVAAIQDNGRCEANNEIFLNWLSDVDADLDDLVESAIESDGRGHFLSFYDGEELEVDHYGKTYYVYRV